MTEYILTYSIGDYEKLGMFYARCRELGVRSRIVKDDFFLRTVYEFSSEDLIAMKLAFPGVRLQLFQGFIDDGRCNKKEC